MVSLKQELSVLKTVLDNHPALKVAVEKLVATANEMTTNGTTHTKTNSTHKENDFEISRHDAVELVRDVAAHRQEVYDSDSNRHGDDPNHDNQKVPNDQQHIKGEVGEIDRANRPRDTIDANHPAMNQDRNYRKDAKVTNGTNYKASKSQRVFKDKPSKNLAGKSSLMGDARSPSKRAQSLDDISNEKRRNQYYAAEDPD